MRHPSKFWDRIAERYEKRPVADEAAYQRKLEVTRGYLTPEMEVLELGCGTGSTAIAHAPYVKRILAVDISSKMLAIARAKAKRAGVANISFQRSDIDGLNIPDQSCDAVLALSVLHLLDDRDRAISKVYRLLKPGGVFVSSTVCIGDFMKYLRLIAPVGRFVGLLPLLRIFTADELEHSIVSAGFVIDHRWQPGRGKAVFIVAQKPPGEDEG